MARVQTVFRVEVHQLPGAFELRSGKIRPVAQHSLDPLIVDGVRLSSSDQSMQGFSSEPRDPTLLGEFLHFRNHRIQQAAFQM